MAGEESKKKERDPIFMICLALFTIAAAAVLCVFVADHFFSSDDSVAAYGDTVTVDYTGAYNGYVGEEHAVVFDTSYSKVANNDDIKKSNEFTKKSSYSPLEVTLGEGSLLKGFENAIPGHKVGDVFKVYIPASEAYVGAETKKTAPLSGYQVPLIQTMPSRAFSNLYGFTPSSGSSQMFTTVYGWEAEAAATSDSNMVTITNLPKEGSTYTFSPGGKAPEAGDEKLKFTVTGMTSEAIVCNLSFVNTSVILGNSVEMMGFDFGTEKWYVKEVSSSDFTYKTSSERVNEDLYFEIKLVSIN